MIEYIKNADQVLAIIIYANFHDQGIKFFTSDDYSQQLAYMNRPEGYVIKPHIHNPVPREVQFTKEVLFIKSGVVRTDFYDDNKDYLESRVLNAGDVVLLAYGGHGFEIIEASEIIEVKQGPYSGEQDKTRFEPVDHAKLLIRNMLD